MAINFTTRDDYLFRVSLFTRIETTEFAWEIIIWFKIIWGSLLPYLWCSYRHFVLLISQYSPHYFIFTHISHYFIELMNPLVLSHHHFLHPRNPNTLVFIFFLLISLLFPFPLGICYTSQYFLLLYSNSTEYHNIFYKLKYDHLIYIRFIVPYRWDHDMRCIINARKGKEA